MSESTPVLYHLPNAICAQKVRVCLAEKDVRWDSRDVNGKLRSPDYLKLNPRGYVPTLAFNGKIVTESRVISEFVDEMFDGPSLQPTDPFQRSIMRRWSKEIDDSLHASIFLLTFVPFFRGQVMELPDREQKRILPLDPIKAERMRNMMELGWDSPFIGTGLLRFQRLITDMEESLKESPWLAGSAYSLADADYTPYLKRMEDLGLCWLWEDKSLVTDWYSRIRSRPSFSAVVDDWSTAEEQKRAAIYAAEIGPKFKRILLNESLENR